MNYEAEISSDNAEISVCQRCKELVEPGVDLFYMKNIQPDKAGRYVCEGCHDYYLGKTTTRRRDGKEKIPYCIIRDYNLSYR